MHILQLNASKRLLWQVVIGIIIKTNNVLTLICIRSCCTRRTVHHFTADHLSELRHQWYAIL